MCGLVVGKYGASIGSMVGALKAVGGGAFVAPNPALVVPAFGATSAVVAAGATSGSFFRVVAFVMLGDSFEQQVPPMLVR